MDNAPYHHARDFPSFSAITNKSELIKTMVEAGVTQVTLRKDKPRPHQEPTPDAQVPINADSAWQEFTDEKLKKKVYKKTGTKESTFVVPPEGVSAKQPPKLVRTQDTRIDISKTVDSSLPNADDDKQGHTATDETRATKQWYYASTGARGGEIPTIPELKEACILECTENHPELLKCQIQKFLEDAGHDFLWTPAYTPWLQPIETYVPLPPVRPARASPNWWLLPPCNLPAIGP